jgi:uncharacterized RDD family membrane protein YckC
MVRDPVSDLSEKELARDVSPVPAGFLRRFLALLTDILLVGIVVDVVEFAYRLGSGKEALSMGYERGFGGSFLLFTAYCVILLGENGQTLGKRLFDIRVVRSDGSPITYGRAFFRTILYVVSWVPFSLGFLWALWDRRKQAWHDKIVDTVVIRD